MGYIENNGKEHGNYYIICYIIMEGRIEKENGNCYIIIVVILG